MAVTPSYTLRGPVGVVIAHPDDESMFFTPALSTLKQQGKRVLVLCLSSGNFHGLGETRKRELLKACHVFGIPEDDVNIIEHPELQDGSAKPWPAEVVATQVREFVQKNSVNSILTFDERGVSGHSDHTSVSRGVALYLRIRANSSGGGNKPVDAYALEDTWTLRKYMGLLDLPWSCVEANSPPLGAFFLNFNIMTAWRAMASHRSQFVWYRRLFVIFSRYVYMNNFKRLNLP
ncbi:unnamed protein product, partial [Ascophyllum nodosum]